MNKSSLPNHLKKVLADTYTLYLQTQWSHWNITGAHFFALHEAFGDQYAEMAEAIDELAEQLRQLGEISPGSFQEFVTIASFPHDTTALSTTKMLTVLIKQQEATLRDIAAARKAFQDAGDEATTDLLISRERAHQKQLWMLRATAAKD